MAQREGRNNAAALNLLKLDYLRVNVFFGSVDLARVTKLFFVIVLKSNFFASDKQCIINSLYCYLPTSGIESTKAHTSSLYAMSVPTLINESSKN